MEGVFFAVQPIWWILPIHLTSLIIAMIGGLIVGFFVWRRTTIKKNNGVIQTCKFEPIQPEDTEYATKTLAKIREYLTLHYVPVHSWAHIPDDIALYSRDARLIAIIRELEEMEYSGKIYSIQQKESINNELIAKLLP